MARGSASFPSDSQGVLAARLRAGYRAQLHAWMGHGLVLGVFAGLLLLCVAFASGAEGLTFDPLAIAGVGALFTVGLVFGAGYRPWSAWVSRLDRRLKLRGALLAGLQAEAQGGNQPVQQLLLGELLPKVDRRRILQEGIFLHLWLLALPFLAGAFLLHNIKDRRQPDVHWQALSGQLQGLQENVDGALAAWQAQDPSASETHATWLALSRQVRTLAVQEELGQAEQPEWGAALQELAQEVQAANQSFDGPPEVEEAMAQAQNRLDWMLERAAWRGVWPQPDGEEQASGQIPGNGPVDSKSERADPSTAGALTERQWPELRWGRSGGRARGWRPRRFVWGPCCGRGNLSLAARAEVGASKPQNRCRAFRSDVLRNRNGGFAGSSDLAGLPIHRQPLAGGGVCALNRSVLVGCPDLPLDHFGPPGCMTPFGRQNGRPLGSSSHDPLESKPII